MRLHVQPRKDALRATPRGNHDKDTSRQQSRLDFKATQGVKLIPGGNNTIMTDVAMIKDP